MCLSQESVADTMPYAVQGQCDGLPRLPLTTPPGFCVGLVAHGFAFPRGIAPLKNGDLLVVDMGSWEKQAGSLWLLQKAPGGQGYSRKKLLAGLDRPHGIALGPDGLPYVGITSGVFRFDPYAPAPQDSRVDVIGGSSGVPGFSGSGRHPLIPVVFDTQGALFVGIGSASDNCESSDLKLPRPDKPCAEAEGEQARGTIRQYMLSWPEGKVVGWHTYAFGLRNSLAMAVHPHSNRLLQAENGRDAIHRRLGLPNDEEFPHDELNLIEAGRHYGWPYCYDAGKASPEFPRTDCRRYQSPLLLLPPHAAPLGMTYYFGSMFPKSLAGALLVGYHGYRKHGHRLVAFPTDASGMPTGSATLELISNWQDPLGAPVDVKVAPDGALVLTEDRNKTVLRVFFAPTLP